MNLFKFIFVAFILFAFSTKANDVQIIELHKNKSLDQLVLEKENNENEEVNENKENDQMITGAGLILFWPALFFIGGTKEQEAEYARLKGEYEALDKVAIKKNCLVR